MQMTKITAMLLALGMAAGSAQAASSIDGGNITFKGAITTSPCGITADSADQVVDLGTVTASKLKKGEEVRRTPFSIVLTDCELGTQKTAKVKFTGAPASGNDELLGLQGTEGAKGAGIAIMSDNNTVIKPGADSPAFNLNNGDNVLRFQAQVQRINDTAEVTAGRFNVQTGFLVSYD